MVDKRAIKIETLDRLAEGFQESRGISDKLSIEQMIELAKEKVSGGENKLAQLVEGTITEITAEDLEGVTKLKDYALKDLKSLQKLGIPNSVKEFGKYAVENCSADVYYEGEPWEWCCIKRSSSAYQSFKNIYSNGKLIEHLELSAKNAVQINSYVKGVYITTNAFMNCESIKSLKISGTNVRYEFDSNAFKNCINLTSVFIGNNKFGTGVPNYSTSITPYLFSGCTNLTDIYVCWAEGEISNAPWGATNATIHYNTPIHFLIGEKEYSFLINMTWAEWCNSEYNTDGFYIDENDKVRAANGLYVTMYNDYYDSYETRDSSYTMSGVDEYFIKSK